MASAASQRSGRGGDVAPLRLVGPWGELVVGFGEPRGAALVVDVGLPTAVSVQVTGSHALADRAGIPQAGLVQRAILASRIAGVGGVVLHAAATVDEAGEATLFLGRSGAGKTTVSTQAHDALLGDDTVVIWPDAGELRVLATPFVSEGGHPAEIDRGRPMAVCTLGWGPQTRVERISGRALLEALIRSVYRPPEPTSIAPVMATLMRLAEAVEGYRLIFPRNLCLPPGGPRRMVGQPADLPE